MTTNMDESFMSIGSFDEDSVIAEFSLNNDSPQLGINTKKQTQKSIDISGLLTEPLEDGPKSKLNFNDSETPRNTSIVKRQRKRKNLARRCLSTDLNNEYSLKFEDDSSLFQDVRQTKEIKKSHEGFLHHNILSAIENRSPNKSNQTSEKTDRYAIALTPEFDTQKIINNNISYIKNYIPRIPLKVNNQSGLPLQKSFSENHASIKRAIQLSSIDSSLIGDFSKQYILPLLINCKHQDLKAISSHVLADVIRGVYSDVIESFVIVDCRYPYEFEGGHIQSAINLYTQEQVLAKFVSNRTKEAEISKNASKRNIMIFHCEFSSERGPALCRFLRNKDRVKNSGVYPSLYYPELYLLEGGYKDFYTKFPTFCEPNSYMPMHSKEHEDELRKYRSLVKSHSFDSKFSAHKRNLRL